MSKEKVLWDGQYELLRTLGRGGMATVYLAEDTLQDRRKVALKILRPEFTVKRTREEYGVWDFKEEYDRMCLFESPHIPRVYSFKDEPLPYFAMEYFPGKALLFAIPDTKEGREICLPRRMRSMAEICNTLGYVHSHGILHRDIKPGNILVNLEHPESSAKLIDFGLSSRIGDPPESAFIGTSEYSAPEVLGCYMFDERSDLYAVGLVLYEIVTGRKPWVGSDIEDLYEKRMEGAYPPIENGCDPQLKSLIDGLLKPYPRDRPRTVAEVTRQLETIVRGTK